MMAEAYDLDGSLTTCDTLRDQTAQEGCWQGVFMENVNGALQGRGAAGRLHAGETARAVRRRRGPLPAPVLHQPRGLAAARERRRPRRGLARPASTRPRDYVSVCMESLGLMVTNPVWQATLASGPRRPFGETAWSLCTPLSGGSPARLRRRRRRQPRQLRPARHRPLARPSARPWRRGFARRATAESA